MIIKLWILLTYALRAYVSIPFQEKCYEELKKLLKKFNNFFNSLTAYVSKQF